MDRNKVIKGLECCSRPKQENCLQCPYRYPAYPSGDRDVWLASCQQLYKDALELLKDQETLIASAYDRGYQRGYEEKTIEVDEDMGIL